jgi:nucleoid-associated protein YgaU
MKFIYRLLLVSITLIASTHVYPRHIDLSLENNKKMVAPIKSIASSKSDFVGNINYTIKSGDWLSKIAEIFYGDPLLYNRIYEANKNSINNPDLIYTGKEILIPNVDVTYSYTVKTGDKLSDIAETFLGSSNKANELIEQNKDILEKGNQLIRGQVIEIKYNDGTVCYTVRSGDWISKIAEIFYDDAYLYPWLFQKNKHIIKEQNLIFPGQQILIPPG